MAIRIRCPSCKTINTAEDRGVKFRCTGCEKVLVVRAEPKDESIQARQQVAATTRRKRYADDNDRDVDDLSIVKKKKPAAAGMRTGLVIAALALLVLLVFVLGGGGLTWYLLRGQRLPPADTPAPAIQNDGRPPTEDEAKEFAAQMAQAVKARDAAAIDRLVRMDNLAERTVSDLGLSANERQAFLRGAANAMQQNGLGQQIVQAIKDEGSYKLLRIRIVDGRPRPLFRLISSEGSVNYHEYILARHNDGKVATEDIHIYATGERLSQTLRQILIPVLQRKGAFAKIDAEEENLIKTLGNMGNAARIGDFKGAINFYRSLPKRSKESRTALVMCMMAASRLGPEGDADYMDAMETFRRLYPDDSAIDLLSIDYFFLKKRFDEAHKAIDRIDKALGGDAYMNSLRGNLLMEAGKFPEARQSMEKAIEAEPDLANAYWCRITLSLREQNHADTLKWLKAVVQKCNVPIANLNGVPDYAGFVRSPQYREWQRWHAAHGNNKQ